MTNAELIAKIKAEIERLKGIGGIVPLDNREQKTGYESALIDIEIFLDTLESEKPVPADLEEAAKDYTDSSEWSIGENLEHIDAAFIAGAEWQAKQMMKEAVEGKIIFLLNGDVAINIGDMDEYKLGDKVRVIIVKED